MYYYNWHLTTSFFPQRGLSPFFGKSGLPPILGHKKRLRVKLEAFEMAGGGSFKSGAVSFLSG